MMLSATNRNGVALSHPVIQSSIIPIQKVTIQLIARNPTIARNVTDHQCLM